jgi:hypothetical protein
MLRSALTYEPLWKTNHHLGLRRLAQKVHGPDFLVRTLPALQVEERRGLGQIAHDCTSNKEVLA